MQGIPNHNNETTPVELHFFTCKAPIEIHKIPVKDFAYRKRTNQERELPESLKESAYFRISFDKEMKDAKYYLKSQIGLFAKVAPYRELLIWALDYANGKALETGSISIHTLDGKELFRGQPKNGLVRFSLH